MATTLSALLDNYIDFIAPNTNDERLYRIYVGAGRLETTCLPIAERHLHPEWFTTASGDKSFLDQFMISEYMANNESDVLTPFLATVALTFGVGLDQAEVLSDQFYTAVRKSHLDTIEIEDMMRDAHATVH